MQRWLLTRLFNEDQPTPHFAFYGTVNWMRALALLADDAGFSREDLCGFYAGVQRRPLDRSADTLVFENVFLAFNHLAGLIAITNVEQGYDVCRPAISAWYHCIHSSAAAMVAAASGRRIEHPRDLVLGWQHDLLTQNLVLRPFSPATSTLVKMDAEKEVRGLRKENPYDLGRTPTNAAEAWGGVVSYLHGTAKFDREQIEERIRGSMEFSLLNVADFRTRRARELRDGHLKASPANFVSAAARYVGKASYRDSIFLSYGDNHELEIDRFLIDLGDVATAFLAMTCAYCSQRTEQGAWGTFVSDVESNSRVSLSAEVLSI